MDKSKYTKNVVRATTRTDTFLNSMIDDHQSRLITSIKQLENNIIDMTTEFKLSDGVLMGPKVNLKLAREFHKKLLIEFDKTYGAETRKMVRGYKSAATFIKRSFKEIDEVVSYTSVDKSMMQALQTNSFNNFATFSTATQGRLMESMYGAVIGRQKYSTFVNEIQSALSGYKDKKGRSMSQYAELYANDGVMNFHNEVQLKKAGDIGLKHFLYYGNVMGTTRDFCRQRVGKVYSKEEIESWTFPWNGKSGSAMTSRGGYRCRHHWQPVRATKMEPADTETGLVVKPPKPKPVKPKKPKKPATTVSPEAAMHAAKREFMHFTKKGMPGEGARSWKYASEGSLPAEMGEARYGAGWEVRKQVYALSNETLTTRAAYIDSLPAKEQLVERQSIVRNMVRDINDSKNRPSILRFTDKEMDRLVITTEKGMAHIPTPMVLEMDRAGLRINWSTFRGGRAEYGDGVVTIFNGNSSQVVAHEVGHALDSFMGTGGRTFGDTGLVWKNQGRFVGEVERTKLRKWYMKNTTGGKGTYVNGDGDYFRGNWIHQYEGRIYDRRMSDVSLYPYTSRKELTQIGNEWWAMNSQRFNVAYSRAVKEHRYVTNIWEGGLKKATKDLEDLKSVAHPNKALIAKKQELIAHYKKRLRTVKFEDAWNEVRLTDAGWVEVRETYPELADFMEDFYLKRAAVTPTVKKVVKEVVEEVVEKPMASIGKLNNCILGN